MQLTRTVAAALLASTLLIVPAEAGWKMRVLKGVAIGVGGYMLGQTAAQAEEANPATPVVDPSVIGIVKNGVRTALELYQNGFNSEMCRATEHLTIQWREQENTALFSSLEFMTAHHNCCKLSSNQYLSEISAIASFPGQFRNFPASDATNGALLAFINAGMKDGTYMKIYELGLGTKHLIGNACVTVAKVHNAM